MGRPKRLVVVGCSLRAAAVALVCVVSLPGCQAGDAAPAAITPKPAAKVVTQVWQPGKRYAYLTQLNSNVSAAGQTMMAFALTGELSLEARQTAGETQFFARLLEPAFKAENPELQAQFDALGKELGRGFGFSLASGKLAGVWLQDGASAFAASIARTLAAAFQYAPHTEGQASWSAQEVDATGKYVAEYRVSPDGKVSKRKLRYDDVALSKVGIAQLGSGAKPQVIESTGMLELGDSKSRAPLVSLRSAEKLDVQLTPTARVVSTTGLELKLRRDEALATPTDWTVALAGTRRHAPDEAQVTAAPNYDAERIGTYTFETALQELEAPGQEIRHEDLIQTVRGEPLAPESLNEREKSFAQRGRVFSATAALLRTDGRNVAKALDRIRAGSRARRILLDALSSAGTSEAQVALVSAMNDPKLNASVRNEAAYGLTRTPRATPASVTALEQHLKSDDPLRLFALYGSGTIARRLSEAGEAERAEAIVQSLLRLLEQAKSPQDRVDVLRALANSGSSSAFSAVEPLLTEQAPQVRAAAIDALRLMNHPGVDAIVAAALTRADRDMQAAAIDAMSVREPSPVLVRALDSAVQSSDLPDQLRIKAVKVMGYWLHKQPELRPTLARLAESDKLEQVRQAAKKALET